MRRDEIVPLAWFAAVVVVLFVIASAAGAHADPGTEVCRTLDAHPTVGGIIDALDDLQTHGLSHRESAVALMESVAYTCPIHAGLLRKLMDRTQPAPAPRELVA